jgi:hypothetical protein
VITASFTNVVLKPVRALLGPRIRVPSEADWDFDDAIGEIVLTLPAEALERNLQTQLAASPSYLFCLGYWLEYQTGRPISCLLRVASRTSANRPSLPHWRRSVFVIEQFVLAADGRFRVTMGGGLPRWEWPKEPLLNVATRDRSNAASAAQGKEHLLEVSLSNSDEARLDFGANVGPIRRFLRQLPLGMFDGQKSREGQWTPGGKSQIDLWTSSKDRETIHLFELKAEGNSPAGMLPQAIYYACLLHYLRVGVGDGKTIAGADRSLDAIRSARRIQMWLAGPGIHPLLLNDGKSPLERVNAAFASGDLAFGILPLELNADSQWSRWCWDRRWPRQATD